MPRLDGDTEDARGRVPVKLRCGSVDVLGREVYTQLRFQQDSAPDAKDGWIDAAEVCQPLCSRCRRAPTARA